MIRVSDLRHRVAIIGNTGTTVSASGVPSITWSNVATVYAKIEPLSAHEKNVADQTFGKATHKFTMRYRSDLTLNNENRFTYDGRTFHVKSLVNVMERHRWTIAIADEDTTTENS